MKNALIVYVFIINILFFGCTLHSGQQESVISTSKTISKKDSIISVLKHTADWQIKKINTNLNQPPKSINPRISNGHTRATFLSGLIALYEITKDKKYLNFVNNQAVNVNYEIHDCPSQIDKYAIGKVYADLYLLNRDSQIIADMLYELDEIIDVPKEERTDITHMTSYDTSFTTSLVWVKAFSCTGKKRYLEEMDTLFWSTYMKLYSSNNHNSAHIKTINSSQLLRENMLWNAENGSIIGGVTDILANMPSDYSNRPKYEALFKQIIAEITEVQRNEGSWLATSPDDPLYANKKFSSSAFYCYGIAWGLNHNILDKNIYLPIVLESWNTLSNYVAPEGYIDPMTNSSSVTNECTEEFNSGAFLLAGKEIAELLKNDAI
ncbi:MAG: glycoside hydrolase family 88 protein [Reichenbachiella sp.]|uniref:glycoside hydrolase family 88 protein n=1 Tax=Reichenbachiella sp. TaxID=2184521 RepID=UPI003297F040